MNYFRFNITRDVFKWGAGIPESEFNSIPFFAKDQFSIDEFWELERILPFQIWTEREDKEAEFDIYDWQGDITHHPPIMGKPTSFSLLVSQKTMNVLEEFSLPNHRIYQAVVKNEHSGTERAFNVVHLANMVFSDLSYSQCEFELRSRTELIKTYKLGEIISFEDYENEQLLQRKENRRASLLPKKYIYSKAYDLLPTIGYGIVCSENLKMALEEMEGKGFQFLPINNHLIE